jgi:hypothetical protein
MQTGIGHAAPHQLLAAGRDRTHVAIGGPSGIAQDLVIQEEFGFGVLVAVDKATIERQGDELFLDEANGFLGPDGRRTAARGRRSAAANGRSARAGPDEDGLPLLGSLFPRLPDAQQPGNLVEAQLTRLWLGYLVELLKLLRRNQLRLLGTGEPA